MGWRSQHTGNPVARAPQMLQHLHARGVFGNQQNVHMQTIAFQGSGQEPSSLKNGSMQGRAGRLTGFGYGDRPSDYLLRAKLLILWKICACVYGDRSGIRGYSANLQYYWYFRSG